AAGPVDAGGETTSAGALAPGEKVIVATGTGPALGTVSRPIPPIQQRRAPAAVEGTVRKATPQEILTKLKQEAREREAHRVCLMKIRERQLPMKLTRVEQL